jgi:hypothetical protein
MRKNGPDVVFKSFIDSDVDVEKLENVVLLTQKSVTSSDKCHTDVLHAPAENPDVSTRRVEKSLCATVLADELRAPLRKERRRPPARKRHRSPL